MPRRQAKKKNTTLAFPPLQSWLKRLAGNSGREEEEEEGLIDYIASEAEAGKEEEEEARLHKKLFAKRIFLKSYVLCSVLCSNKKGIYF